MALIRPVVLVFQEFATPTVTPTTPDLNCLVVGPVYHIQDYFSPGTTTPADKADIKLTSDYGALEADVGTPTPVGAGVITTPEPPNNVVGAVLDADSVVIYFDQARVIIAAGTKATTTSTIPNDFVTVETSPTTFNTPGPGQVFPGDRVILTDGSVNLVRTVYAVVSDTELTFTQDLPSVGWTFAANQSWRLERQLNDQIIATSFFTISGNAISVNGSITLNVPNQGLKTVSYAKVYVQYRALRQDLQNLDTVTSTNDILAKLGRLDTRNPLAVGVFVALQNTTSRIQFFGVSSDDLPGYTKVRDALASRPDVYAIVPLNRTTTVIAMFNTDNIGLALPDEVRGRPQRFRVVIGSGKLPTTQLLIEPQTTGQDAQLASSAPATINQLTIPGASLITNGVLPGDVLTIALDTGGTNLNGTYTVAQVISATVLQVDGAFPIAHAANVLTTYGITGPGGSPTRRAPAVSSSAGTSAQGPDLYLLLKDPNGSFVSSGVIPGDLIEMPGVVNGNGAVEADPSIIDYTTVVSFVVANVLSENRVLIVNNGVNTSTAENELPHGVKRTGGSLVATTATLNYRVSRNLSKDGQVTNLVAEAQSFRSRRCILVWPDTCDVAGVVGGLSQPGYYLSCAVGGMTAGLPSHQGFTFLGIAGISQIYNSNVYFTDAQLTDLSNGGWYVFAQQTPQSLPFTIHQLTTDTSTLESGEYSVVKNFDFVSLFFVDILDEFLGIYNVNQDTLVLIQAALNIGGDTLKLRTFARIGAPLTSFNILDLGVSPIAADRVVTHISVGLPKPLNVVELHLVA